MAQHRQQHYIPLAAQHHHITFEIYMEGWLGPWLAYSDGACDMVMVSKIATPSPLSMLYLHFTLFHTAMNNFKGNRWGSNCIFLASMLLLFKY
jgi:hypothetical protein